MTEAYDPIHLAARIIRDARGMVKGRALDSLAAIQERLELLRQ